MATGRDSRCASCRASRCGGSGRRVRAPSRSQVPAASRCLRSSAEPSRPSETRAPSWARSRDCTPELVCEAVYLICSHADVIKAFRADSLGLHLDLYQRIQIDPCSLSVIRYTPLRPFVERMNDTGGSVTSLIRKDKATAGAPALQPGDAPVGGGAGG